MHITGLISDVFFWIFGEVDNIILLLFSLSMFEIIFSTMSKVSKPISSGIRKNILKKAMIIMLVAIGNIIDKVVKIDGHMIRNVVAIFYISTEGISILTHAEKAGLPLPGSLKQSLLEIQDTNKHDR